VALCNIFFDLTPLLCGNFNIPDIMEFSAFDGSKLLANVYGQDLEPVTSAGRKIKKYFSI
jgi:hypothetical protein